MNGKIFFVGLVALLLLGASFLVATTMQAGTFSVEPVVKASSHITLFTDDSGSGSGDSQCCGTGGGGALN